MVLGEEHLISVSDTRAEWTTGTCIHYTLSSRMRILDRAAPIRVCTIQYTVYIRVHYVVYIYCMSHLASN